MLGAQGGSTLLSQRPVSPPRPVSDVARGQRPSVPPIQIPETAPIINPEEIDGPSPDLEDRLAMAALRAAAPSPKTPYDNDMSQTSTGEDHAFDVDVEMTATSAPVPKSNQNATSQGMEIDLYDGGRQNRSSEPEELPDEEEILQLSPLTALTAASPALDPEREDRVPELGDHVMGSPPRRMMRARSKSLVPELPKEDNLPMPLAATSGGSKKKDKTTYLKRGMKRK